MAIVTQPPIKQVSVTQAPLISRRASVVLNLLWKNAGLSRYDLMKQTGYGASTVTSLVEQLNAAGLIVQSEPVASGNGRPPQPLSLNPDARYAVGVDFHRVGVTAVLCDLGQRVVKEYHRPISDPDDRSAIMRDVTESIEEILRGVDRSRVLGIGLGAPGSVDIHSGIGRSYCYMPGWHDVPARDFLEVKFGLPVAVDNNVRAAAFGETVAGAAKGYEQVVFIGGRTGIGSGIVLGGRLYAGKTGMAGEVGHMTVERTGPRCRCGKRGCLETVASTPAILARVARVLSQRDGGNPEDILAKLTIREVWERYRSGDQEIADALRDIADYIAVACINVNLMFEPEIIVLGGDFVLGGDAFLSSVRESIAEAGGSVGSKSTRVVLSELGQVANALGAGCLAVQKTLRLFAAAG